MGSIANVTGVIPVKKMLEVTSNNEAVKNGERILAAYMYGDTKIWIITEWDRSATTILFPEEY